MTKYRVVQEGDRYHIEQRIMFCWTWVWSCTSLEKALGIVSNLKNTDEHRNSREVVYEV